MQLGTDRPDACARAGMKNSDAPAVKREEQAPGNSYDGQHAGY